MKSTTKQVTVLILALFLALFAALGLANVGAKASTLDSFEANRGDETDFQDTWGQGKMSADIIDGDKTLVRGEGIAWGSRMVNNYSQKFDGATFDADVYLAGVAPNAQTIYYAPGDAGQYWDANGGLNIFFIETDETHVDVKVGWWEPDKGLDSSRGNLFWSKNYTHDGTVNVKSALADNQDGTWTLNLTVDGDANEIVLTEEQWAKVGGDEGYLGCGALVEGKGHMMFVFNDYSDSKREAYEADLPEVMEGVAAMQQAYETAKTFTSSSSLSDASDVLYTVTEKRNIISSNPDSRRFEKGRANWYYSETLAILSEKFMSDEDAYDLVQIGVAVNYFADKAEVMETEADVEAVEELRKNVDFDRLDELSAEGFEGADEIVEKYNTAKGLLDDKKDYFVNEHLKVFENAVKDLSTNEKIRAAADLQKNVIITNAKLANREAYTARYNAASETLIGTIKGYAGELADNWDIHNVTFVQSNRYGEINYSASDYYNNDSSNDVGITLKGKVKLDGLSFEITVDSEDYHKDSWFGFFITKERSLFVSSSETSTGLNESRGVITLLKPFAADPETETAAYTQLRMGYPNLYGNEGDVIATIPADLYGNMMKFEFKKETVEGVEYYNCYVTVTKDESTVVERYLAKSMLAETVDKELDADGMGYLTFGSCDATLTGMNATIHTINGEEAAKVTGLVTDEPNEPDDPNQPDEPEKGGCGGCGSISNGNGPSLFVGLIAMVVCAGAVFAVYRRKSQKS